MDNMRKPDKYFVLLFLLFFTSCSSFNYNLAMKDAEAVYYNQKDPYNASKKLIDYANKKNENQLLFLMEAGYLLHAAKKHEESKRVLLAADRKADDMAKSMSKEALSYIINEKGKKYRGEDFERVIVNMINGLNFLMLRDFDGALVEFKKVNYKLKVIKKRTGKIYKINLMAKYLASVAAALVNDLDYSYVELKQIEKIKPGIPLISRSLIILSKRLGYDDDFREWIRKYPRSVLQKNISPYKNSSEVVVIYQSGKAPVKVSRGKLLKEPGMKKALMNGLLIAIATKNAGGITAASALYGLRDAEHPIAKYKRRNYRISRVELELANKDNKNILISPKVLNDVEYTMTKNFEDNYRNYKKKMVAGIATKVIIAMVAQKGASKAAKRANLGAASALIGLAIGVVASKILFSTQKPDLRCWHTIPANFQAGSRILPAGLYTGKIKFYDKSNNFVREQELKPFRLGPKEPFILLIRTTE